MSEFPLLATIPVTLVPPSPAVGEALHAAMASIEAWLHPHRAHLASVVLTESRLSDRPGTRWVAACAVCRVQCTVTVTVQRALERGIDLAITRHEAPTL